MGSARRGRDENIRVVRAERQGAYVRLLCPPPVLPEQLEVDGVEDPDEGPLLRHGGQEAPVLGDADPAERRLVGAEDGLRARHPRLVDLHHERSPRPRPQAPKDGKRPFPPKAPQPAGVGKRGNGDEVRKVVQLVNVNLIL